MIMERLGYNRAVREWLKRVTGPQPPVLPRSIIVIYDGTKGPVEIYPTRKATSDIW